MTQFEFATSQQIIFGCGRLKESIQFITAMGRRVFVVTGRSDHRAAPLLTLLENAGLDFTTFHVQSEPTTATALTAVRQAREVECDVVAGIGGGSVLDMGKVAAALLTNTGELYDYLEVVGKGLPITRMPAPYIAIPTTAGTGAEVTRNAVLESAEHQVKVSMRSALMLPRIALIDPELTYSMPPDVTAFTGMDALTQLIEAFVSEPSNPLTDAICREGLFRAGYALADAYQDGDNRIARENMACASLFGGLALANTKLGAVHGLAGPMGGMRAAPHGALCASLLPYVMEANIEALQNRKIQSNALQRYEKIAQILCGADDADAYEGIEHIYELCGLLNTPSTDALGFTQADIPDIVAKAQHSSSMRGNPVLLHPEELSAILEKAMRLLT